MIPTFLGNYTEHSDKFYWRLGTPYWSHLQGLRNQKVNFLEEIRLNLLRGGSLKMLILMIRVLQILKTSDLTHCGICAEIKHFPKEGEIRLKIRILIAGFPICDAQTRKEHILEGKINVKFCVQRDS